jgi:hypothetical protein
MTPLRTLATLAAALSIVAFRPAPAAHAAHPLAGKWNVEYERGRSNMNGTVNVIMGKAIIELAQRGDSLVGTLTPEQVEGRPPQPVTKIAGTGSGISATLYSESVARINSNGDEQQVTVSLKWELTATGDALTGTMTRSSPGMQLPGGPAPVKGTRVK